MVTARESGAGNLGQIEKNGDQPVFFLDIAGT